MRRQVPGPLKAKPLRGGVLEVLEDTGPDRPWLVVTVGGPVATVSSVGDGTGGGPAAGGDDAGDPFAQLLDPSFAESAELREPSAEDRARAAAESRAAARAAREADLSRRLVEEQQQTKRVAKRDRKASRRKPGRAKKILGPVIAIGIVAGLAWTQTSGSNTGLTSANASARPADYPPVDTSASDEPLGTPPPAPQPAGPYEFVQTQQVGTGPIAWDPCRPIRYVVNSSGAPPGADAMLETAVANTSAATGLQFVNAGTTDEPWTKDREAYQPDRYGEQWAPALIAWSTAGAVPGIAGYIAGMGGGTPRADTNGKAAYVTGEVVLDSQDVGLLLAAPDGANAARAIIQHELGHLVGLDHVADPTQLMYTEGAPTQTGEWGSGDLAGLHILGTQACFPEL